MIDLVRLQHWYNKQRIKPAHRIEFYEALTILLENNVKLDEALTDMYVEYSDNEKKPNAPLALLLSSCLTAINRGKKLTVGLRNWIPQQELSLLSAGEESGKLEESLYECIRLIGLKSRIAMGIAKAIAYPTVLGILMAVMLVIISVMLIPKMIKVSNPDSWGTSGTILYNIAMLVTNDGVFLFAGIIFSIVWFMWSLPRKSTLFNGNIRVFLDRFPPWSLYRIVLGATFLLNLSLLLKSGIGVQKALSSLAMNASPWLKQRIDAINSGVTNGNNIGTSMRNAGYEFPDRKAIGFLVILGNADGIESALSRFANRWMEKSIKYIDVIAVVMLVAGLVVIGGLMAVVILGSNDMSNQITQQATTKTN